MHAPAGRCIVLPDHVDLHGATLIEPLSCVVRGYDVLDRARRLGAHLRRRNDGPFAARGREAHRATMGARRRPGQPASRAGRYLARLHCGHVVRSTPSTSVRSGTSSSTRRAMRVRSRTASGKSHVVARFCSSVSPRLSSRVDLAVHDLQPRDHDHRIDGRPAQPSAALRICSLRRHRGLAGVRHPVSGRSSSHGDALASFGRRRGREDAGASRRVAVSTPSDASGLLRP